VGQAILPASGLSGGSVAQADSFRQSTKKRSGNTVIKVIASCFY